MELLFGHDAFGFGVFFSHFDENGIINEKILDEWTNSNEIYAYTHTDIEHTQTHTHTHINIT